MSVHLSPSIVNLAFIQFEQSDHFKLSYDIVIHEIKVTSLFHLHLVLACDIYEDICKTRPYLISPKLIT